MLAAWGTKALVNPEKAKITAPVDTPAFSLDTIDPLPYPFIDQSFDPTDKDGIGGLHLSNPSNVSDSVKFNPRTNEYEFQQKMGKQNFRYPSTMTLEEYLDYDLEKTLRKNWKARTEADSKNKVEDLNKPTPKLHFKAKGEIFNRIFGGDAVDIRPQGSAELIFGWNTNKNENPNISVDNQKNSFFDFNQKIQLNLLGKIGDKMKITTNYNTEATFDFENQVKLEYTGYEDEIIKKIEAGNVSLPLTGTLITGSQSLFGIKTQLQFGKLTATSIFTQQKGQKKEVESKGGAQTTPFEIAGDNYEANKHFFLSQYFRDKYDNALSSLPLLNSEINITQIEVWVTNTTGNFDQARDIVGFADLGESKRSIGDNKTWFAQSFIQGPVTEPSGDYPDNRGSNNLYQQITTRPDLVQLRSIATALNALAPFNNSTFKYAPVQDYEKINNARKLSLNDFTLNPRLGYISLNQPLVNGEVLAVAYQYTIGTKTYTVGEFSNEVSRPNTLFLKMLKASNVRVKLPIWDLMMKNVYNIGGYGITANDFRLEVTHSNLEKGVDLNYIPEGAVNGKILIQVVGLDRIDQQGYPNKDGVFDFVPDITISVKNGRIYFPVIEPFGKYLRSNFPASESGIADKFVFQELYDSTKTQAQQVPTKNRFKLKGTYKSSSSSEISLNSVNIPQGSVTVTANGIPLTENVDYTVDYVSGKVKVINDALLVAQTPIKASFETNQLFSIQTRSLWGTHLEYKVNKDFVLGGTVLHLRERPITQKINVGDEPIANTIFGFNGNYQTEVPLLTRIVDAIPLINTKEKSTISIAGEYAQLIPGHSKAIGKSGTSYVDDFEGSQSALDFRTISAWSIASTPQGQTSGLFREGELIDTNSNGINRAKLGFYVIDPLFYRDSQFTPDHIKNDKEQRSNHFVREILETEIFPNKQPINNQIVNLPILDLAFYPSERGPYNYDVLPTQYSKGLNLDGTLAQPETRWGGMMRKIETNDFETSNIEFIQFWMMDPFNEDNPNPNTTGSLYFNLGDISEDILHDGQKSFENGLPADGVINPLLIDSTNLALVPSPSNPSVVNAFDNNPSSRVFQDVGLDGLSNTDERTFFSDYLTRITAAPSLGPNSPAFVNANTDPSADDYTYFRSNDFDAAETPILERYKRFNGLEGNSSLNDLNGGPTSSTSLPNIEDINRDNNLIQFENYFQYSVKLTPNSMGVGQNYITDVRTATVQTKDGASREVKWYQFKVPVRSPELVIGEPDIRNVRSVRMFLKGFDKPIICRFARLEFLRGDWRKYDLGKLSGEYEPVDAGNALFNIAAVNVEENSNRLPINYKIPPSIVRERDITTTNNRQLNEQSLVLDICNLEDGNSKAAYKNVDFDMRQYKKLKLFLHEEAGNATDPLNYGDLHFFVRLGTDFNDNYYEYDIPLTPTAWGDNDEYNIWNTNDDQTGANDVTINFAILQDAKKARNTIVNSGESDLTLNQIYSFFEGDRKVSIKGNPNLSSVRVIMFGVRNPKRALVTDADDGLAKCAEIWVNELRLTDFIQQGGWAANAHVTAKLADFATVSVAASRKTEGFGNVEQKLNERSRENSFQYDASAEIKLDKFIPEKIGLSIPMYVGYSETKINPQFDPINPDIKYKESLETFEKGAKRDSVREITQDYTLRRSLNFANVKKERKGTSKGGKPKKPMPYDIENISLRYSYSDQLKRSITVEKNYNRTTTGGLSYVYATQPKNIKPFGKAQFLKSDYFKIIKDFNFNPLPSSFSFSTDLKRDYNEQKTRKVNENYADLPSTYFKRFGFNRVYALKWDLSKSITFDFTANNIARIDEAPGRAYKEFDKNTDEYNNKKDSIVRELKRFGTTTNYNHNGKITWQVPINKIPLLNWTTITTSYTGNFDWAISPIIVDTIDIGNTISNSNQIQINADANMLTLYNKVPYFKKVNSPPPKKKAAGKKETPADKSTGKGEKPGEKSKEAPKEDGESAKAGERESGKGSGGAAADSSKKTKEKEKKEGFDILKAAAKLVMMVKKVSGTYTQTNGTLLPGYMPRTTLIGLSGQSEFGSYDAPGFEFISGLQDPDFAVKAGKNGWLSKSRYLNATYSRTFTEAMNFTANVEPFKDFRVVLNATRNITRANNAIYRYNDVTQEYYAQSPLETGTFSISTNSFKTAFVKDNKNHSSDVFNEFLASRQKFSDEAAKASFSGGIVDSTGYQDGFSAFSQDVLIPAFVSAYTNSSVKSTNNVFKSIPRPNWRVNYDGLSKIEIIKKYFKTFSLAHTYRSTLNIGSYTTNPLFIDEDGLGNTSVRNLDGDFRSRKEINSITLSEQFSPLISIDMTWNNSLLTKVEIKKDRLVTLSIATKQITEVNGNEFIAGLGYRFKNVAINLKQFNMKFKSDLSLRSDFSYRRNQTALRYVDTGASILTSGQKIIAIKNSADYIINEKLNIRFFYDQTFNRPVVSTSYPTSNRQIGISLRLTIAN
jgi:cell surface protein SprA